MVGGDTSADAAFGPQDHRHLGLAAEHISVIGADVNELVHRYRNKIDIHNFSHRPHPPKGRTHRGTCNGCLGYRGVNDLVRAEFRRQPAGCLIRSPVEPDIFAHYDNLFISSELFGLGGGDGLTNRHNIHTELRFDLCPGLLGGLFLRFAGY
ncbi:hypothetical protein ES703_61313 [subsurface metagenome]